MQTEIMKLKEEKKRLAEEMNEKRVKYMIQSEKRSKWNLFNALISFRINGESYNSNIRQDEIVEKAKIMVGQIENHGTENLCD